MEDKRVCPRCGEPLYRQPYLMSIDPDAQPPAWAAPAARLLVLFLVLVAAIFLVSRALASF